MEEFFLTILNSWGSDTPQEVFWALNDLIKYAKTKGFKTTIYFDDPIGTDNKEKEKEIYKNNEQLIKEISEFFNKLK